MKRTHEEYIEKARQINPNIQVLGQYKGNAVKILHRCKACGHRWMVVPKSVLRGCGCPQCAKSCKAKTHEQYAKELKEINPHIIVLEKYVNTHAKIRHQCLVCNYVWEVMPNQLLHGSQCPMCSNQQRRKIHDEYIVELSKANPNLVVLGKYFNNKTKMLFRCKVCENEFESRADSMIFGCGCPFCKQSRGEKEILQYLKEHDVLTIAQATFEECKNIFVLPFDFYLPKYNTCIEYQGEQHYKVVDYFGGEEGFQKRKKNDSIKCDFCDTNNITLLCIRFDQNVNEVLDDFFQTN